MELTVRNPGEAVNNSPPTGPVRTILAAIGMFACARVGGRALPLDVVPQATWGARGGRVGSMGGPRDSGRNRRDGSGVRPQIGRNTGRAQQTATCRPAQFRFRDGPHSPPP